MSWTNEEISRFIELYRSESAIWNPKDILHKDKNKINEAWERISAEMSIPVEALKKKKETMMAAFRLNHKKRLASLKSGDPRDVFTPTWIFYDTMAEFLAELYDYRNGNPYSDDGASSVSMSFQDKWNPVVEVGIEELSNDDFLQEGRPSGSKRRRSESPDPGDTHPHEKYLVDTMTTLAKVINIVSTEIADKHRNEDDCDLFGKLTAIKLRKLDEPERSELMYEIDTLIMQKRFKNEPL